MEYHEFLICVATVNNPSRLEEFLISIETYTKGLDYKISITDDCSNENLSQTNYQLAIKYNCFYTRNKERSGVPFSWNRATELGDCKYLVIANDDILVVPGWLDSYKEFYETNNHLQLGVLAWPATNIRGQQSNLLTYEVYIDVSHVTTPIVACAGYLFAVPRELFMDVGKFDERYFATWEEIDFGAKLCMIGYKSIGLNGPVIYHQGGASFSDPINQHPAMQKQSFAQTQWIDKWSSILNITRQGKSHQVLIEEISNSLTSKIPVYDLDFYKTIKIGSNLDLINPVNNIHGWFDFNDIYLEQVKLANSKSIFIEVGSWLGKSATYMGQLIKESKKKIDFYCVDTWDETYIVEHAYREESIDSLTSDSLLNKFINNLSTFEVQNFVIPLKGFSLDKVKTFDDQSIDFIFLDASHEENDVYNDLVAWFPKLKTKCVFAGHDYYPDNGVSKAVNRFFKEKNIKISKRNNSWYTVKC